MPRGRLESRLARLEKSAEATRAQADVLEARAAEQEARMQAAWEIMRSSMSDEHARLVVEAYESGFQYVLSSGYNTPAGRLLRRCLDAMSHVLYARGPNGDIPPEIVLAMPPQVAEVYLEHPDALPLHDCEDCGYKLPHGYFDACPLCGGRIGWYAYFNRRKAEAKGVSSAEA